MIRVYQAYLVEFFFFSAISCRILDETPNGRCPKHRRRRGPSQIFRASPMQATKIETKISIFIFFNHKNTYRTSVFFITPIKSSIFISIYNKTQHYLTYPPKIQITNSQFDMKYIKYGSHFEGLLNIYLIIWMLYSLRPYLNVLYFILGCP